MVDPAYVKSGGGPTLFEVAKKVDALDKKADGLDRRLKFVENLLKVDSRK